MKLRNLIAGALALVMSGAAFAQTNQGTSPLSIAKGGTGLSALATGMQTFWGTPSSANLRSALTDETGTGSAVFATSPTLVTPVLGAATATTINGVKLTASGTIIGIGTSLTSASGASDSIFIGPMNGLTSGCQNVVIGGGTTGSSLTTDCSTTLIGYGAGPSMHNGVVPNNNTGVGALAFLSCVGCGSSTAVGRGAAGGAVNDSYITAVGHASMFFGSGNARVVAIGDSAGGGLVAGTAIPASPAGYPNVGALVFGFNGDSDVECIGETCGKRSATARNRAFAIGTYSRLLAQDDSGMLGNGLTVLATAGKLWHGGGMLNVPSSVGVTLTAAQVLSGITDRTGGPAGAFIDTLPTAQQIIQSTSGGPGNGCDTNTMHEWTYSNRGTGQTATLQANGGTNPGGGVTIVAPMGLTVASNTVSQWRWTITNCTLSSEAITLYRISLLRPSNDNFNLLKMVG